MLETPPYPKNISEITMTTTPRLEKLRTLMQNTGLDIVAFIPGANLRYLTGGVHYLMERPTILFIPLQGEPVAVLPKLETALFDRHSLKSNWHVWEDAEGYHGAFASALAELDVDGKTIGVEGLRMRFTEGETIRKYAPGATVIAADEQLVDLRIAKDADEIAALRKAIQISQDALQKTLDQVKVGMSERQIAEILESTIKALGGEGLSFDTILKGGGNSALPHSHPSDYLIQPGDALLFDFGATYQGYHADITRTVFVGEPKAEFRAFYEIVKAANVAGRAAAKPGVTAASVDRAARQILIDAGYESLIRHRTGHGIGLETHEDPYIVLGNDRILKSGMTFTVEPGIYKIGEIGVRIEDDVLITEDGSESLTTFTRDLLVVG
jgi:Xaa-Pro dipeptidase